jgi:zinc protease
MHRSRSLAARTVVLALLAFLPIAQAQQLPTDPRLVTGELENGLRYIIRQHATPPQRAAVWMHIHSGSLNESDAQRGIAHYIEHMAFNGSENFPPGSVIPLFESLGLTFGQHQNAFTSFDQTTYQLALPDNKPESLDKALSFFADVAGRLSLLPDEIEKERQVILEERRSRLSGPQRVQEHFFENLAPGSLFGKRLPIGTEDSIKTVSAQDFRDYYSRWYLPSNTTLMVVADMDPAVVVEHIRTHFTLAPVGNRPVAQDPGIKPYTEVRAIVASDPEIADAVAGMAWLSPPRPPTTTEAGFRDDLLDGVSTWMFNRRLYKLVAQGKVDFRGGSSSAGTLFGAGFLAMAAVSGEPAKWKEMLEQLALEIQRVRLHGFTEEELADARKEFVAGAERAVETDVTTAAASILSGMNNAIAHGEPILSPQQELELVQRIVPAITLAEASKRFADLFDTTRPMTFTLQTKSDGVPSEAAVIEAGRAAVQAAPEQQAAAKRAQTLLLNKPAPGEFEEWSEEPESKVWSGWLKNGIRVHYRHMDYRKDQVFIVATIAGGEIQEKPEQRGLTQAGSQMLARPATAEFASTDIEDLMTGLKVGVSGTGGIDTCMLTVVGKPSEVETGVQLAYLLLTDGIVEPPALDQWKQKQRQNLMLRKLEPNRVFTDLVVDTVYPKGEHRVRPLEEAEIARLTPANTTAWMRGILAKGPMELTIVGDLDRAAAEELIKTYFGSLAPRERIGPATLGDLRRLQRPTGPLHAEKKIPTKTDKALLLAGFYGPDQVALRDVRLIHLACRILTTRATEQIREQKQLAYAPAVQSRPGAEFPGFGSVTTVSPTAPDKVEKLTAAVEEMYRAFAKDGPTQEELETARRQFATSLEENMREPQFWVGALMAMTYRGGKIEDTLSAPAQYQSFTADEIREAFARYYKPESTFVVWVAPDPSVPAQGMVIEPGKPKEPETVSPPAPDEKP